MPPQPSAEEAELQEGWEDTLPGKQPLGAKEPWKGIVFSRPEGEFIQQPPPP